MSFFASAASFPEISNEDPIPVARDPIEKIALADDTKEIVRSRKITLLQFRDNEFITCIAL